MREIKFRVWDKENKTLRCDVLSVDVGFKNSNNIYFKEGSFAKPGLYELMQFTGLKDKNGKEIYEGDIVSCVGGYEAPEGYDSHEEPAQVIFDKGTLQFVAKCVCGCEEWPLYEYDLDEVIGNIYESPELLTQ